MVNALECTAVSRLKGSWDTNQKKRMKQKLLFVHNRRHCITHKHQNLERMTPNT